MNNFKSLPKHAVLMIAFAVIALVFTYLVVLPYTNEKPNLDFEHNRAVQKINQYEDYYEHREELSKEISDLRVKWNNLQESTTVTGERIETDINEIAIAVGVDPRSFSINGENVHDSGAAGSNTELCDVSLQINNIMSESQLYDMLERFESKSLGRYRINNVSIRFIDRETVDGHYVYNRGDFQVSINGNLYYLRSRS